jgi:hypothetical protein
MTDADPWLLEKLTFEPWRDGERATIDNVVIVKRQGRFAIGSLNAWWPDLDPVTAQAALYFLQGQSSPDQVPPPNSQCPICYGEAKEVELGTFDGSWIECSGEHGTFGVTDTVLRTRLGESQDTWIAAWRRAKARSSASRARLKIEDADFL